METNIDFFEEQAIRLIGIELQLSKQRKPNLSNGCTVGKAKIKRQLLKRQFGIDTNYKLECLKDALQEKGYSLIIPNYWDDILLINLRLLKTGAEEILIDHTNADFSKLMKDVNEYELERSKIDTRRREDRNGKN
jgi:hypothetical protein